MAVVNLLPRANGDRLEWTVNGAATLWQACQTNDGDTSYGLAAWPGDELVSLFYLDSLPAGVGVITDVTVSVIVRRNNNSLANIRPGYKLGGVETYAGSHFSSSMTYVTVSFGAGARTVPQANALQAGGKLGTNFWGTLCTQVYAAVTYAEGPPTPTTDPASGISFVAATLNGTLANDGIAGASCACGFEWGTTGAYGNTTPTQNKLMGQTFAQTITGLMPSTLYHFRARATNADGTGVGEDATFTTDPGGVGIDRQFTTRKIMVGGVHPDRLRVTSH